MNLTIVLGILLFEAGVEIFNPVQTNAWNLAPDFLKKEFGKDCTFLGGGFVFNTVHSILPDVPPQNIIAMYKAVREFNNKLTTTN